MWSNFDAESEFGWWSELIVIIKCDPIKASQSTNNQYNQQFLLKDRYGHPLKNSPYTIKLPSGEFIHSSTDSHGKTQRHITDDAQNIEVHQGHI
jgi:uncharacterized protein (DUF2345 family)